MRLEKRLITKAIASCLVAAVAVGTVGRGQAMAMMSPAHESAGVNRAGDERVVQSMLEKKIIRQRLHDWGYAPEDVEKRMSRLSDADVHRVASRIDGQIPAGDGGAVWIIVGAVLLLILLIAAIDDDDDDHDDDRDRDSRTDVDVESGAPAANPPQTIIVK